DVSFPLGNAVAACGGLDGLIDLQAAQGSFGKFGFATKLLSVMRATEVLRLRLPPTSDEGVVFDTFTTRLVAQAGVIEVQEANLTSTAYNLMAKGSIDFPANQMRLHVATNPLELVTGVASNVPPAGTWGGPHSRGARRADSRERFPVGPSNGYRGNPENRAGCRRCAPRHRGRRWPPLQWWRQESRGVEPRSMARRGRTRSDKEQGHPPALRKRQEVAQTEPTPLRAALCRARCMISAPASGKQGRRGHEHRHARQRQRVHHRQRAVRD
ncbi:MAG: AsmA-like C-terminal region-containing protein, partial [Candidatus Competibacteraceae bacterium]|nr:AsmA-like C-terminal region-containing protein [Candidatus Competibacteraceae bacterium]